MSISMNFLVSVTTAPGPIVARSIRAYHLISRSSMSPVAPRSSRHRRSSAIRSGDITPQVLRNTSMCSSHRSAVHSHGSSSFLVHEAIGSWSARWLTRSGFDAASSAASVLPSS
jgi:hypothetical protein